MRKRRRSAKSQMFLNGFAVSIAGQKKAAEKHTGMNSAARLREISPAKMEVDGAVLFEAQSVTPRLGNFVGKGQRASSLTACHLLTPPTCQADGGESRVTGDPRNWFLVFGAWRLV